MRRFILGAIAVCSTGLFIVSNNNTLMLKLLDWRSQISNPLGADRRRYGDLYRMSYFPGFRLPDPRLRDEYPDTIKNIKRDINLYTICNSYLLSFVKSEMIFYGVKKYWSGRATIPLHPVLDTTQKNVLLLQMSERSVNMFFNCNQVINNFDPVYPKTQTDTLPVFSEPNAVPRFPLMYSVFNPRVEESLNFNLFDYRFLTPLKEFRSYINYNYFNRMNPDVVMGPKQKNLFLATTVNKNSNISSFKQIDDKELDSLVTCFNSIYTHYKSKGFDEVYLTIVPSRVTILAPQMGNYNMLVPRIQYNPNLKMPYIDLYKKFKTSTQNIYQHADTHWTNYGFKLWVNEFNKQLEDI